jgi:serine/threonine protein phosphatase PrpC
MTALAPDAAVRGMSELFPRPLGPARWVEFCAVTERGLGRPQHEGAVVIGGLAALAPGTRLTGWLPIGRDGVTLAVIEGVGAGAGGTAAAGVVANIVATEAARVDDAVWTPWLEDVSQRVGAAGQAWGAPGMGATAALLRLAPGRTEVVNVGAGRVYRVWDGELHQMTVEDEATDPDGIGPRGAEPQSLGGAERRLDPHLQVEFLPPGEARFMVCSDSLISAAPHRDLRSALVADGSAASICDRLVEVAWASRSVHDFSLVVAIVGPEGAAPPPGVPGGGNLSAALRG